MSIAPFRIVGRLISLLALLAAVGVGYWGTLPVMVDGSTRVWPKTPLQSVPSPPVIPGYTAFASLVDQRLRGPLYDPPPIPLPPPTPPAPIRVDLKLVGTVLEPGMNQAILTNSRGKVLFCRVGETIASVPGGIVLESVTETEAVLRITTPRESAITLTTQERGAN